MTFIFRHYPASRSRVWQDFFRGNLGVFLLITRGLRYSPAPEHPVTEREKPEDGWTVPGAAAKPHDLTGTSITAAEQGAPEGELGKGSRKEAHPCFIIKMLP